MTQLLTRLANAAKDAGVEPAHAELAARTMVYYVLGFTVDEQSRLQWDAAGAELPDGQSVLATNPNGRFAFGLQLLVDGIGAKRQPARLEPPVVLYVVHPLLLARVH